MPSVERRSALPPLPTVFDRLSPFSRAGPARIIPPSQWLGVAAVFTFAKNGENGRKRWTIAPGRLADQFAPGVAQARGDRQYRLVAQHVPVVRVGVGAGDCAGGIDEAGDADRVGVEGAGGLEDRGLAVVAEQRV